MKKQRRIRAGDTLSIPHIGEIEINRLLESPAELRDRHGRRLGTASGRDWLKKYI